MTTLTDAGKQNVLNPNNPDPRLILIEISHESFEDTYYYTNNFEDVIHLGQVYTAQPFEIDLPTDDDGVPRGSVRVSNITREVWDKIGDLDTPAQFAIVFIIASAPDVVQRRFSSLDLRRASVSLLSLEVDFSHENYGAELYPSRRLTPAVFTWINRQG